MLRYLKWLSIAGVWYPIALMAVWGLLGACAFAISPAGGGSFFVLGIYLAFALCHALAVATLVAIGLWVTRQESITPFAMATAILGALISAPVLGWIYFSVLF